LSQITPKASRNTGTTTSDAKPFVARHTKSVQTYWNDYEIRYAVCRKAQQKLPEITTQPDQRRRCQKVEVNKDDHTKTANNSRTHNIEKSKKTQGPPEHESPSGYDHTISKFEKLGPTNSKNAQFLSDGQYRLGISKNAQNFSGLQSMIAYAVWLNHA
jgi:hypothetical protein